MAVTAQIRTPGDLANLREQAVARRQSKRMAIAVCCGTGCRAQGSLALVEEFRSRLEAEGLDDVEVRASGCHGFCERGPLVVIYPKEIFYCGVKDKHVADIIEKSIKGDELVDSLLFRDPVTKQRYQLEHEVPFYAKQQRIVFRNNGKIDPVEINDYIAVDGYVALAKALTQMTPDAVIDEVENAGLRGRGGGGFPTGRKWRICRDQPGDQKYIVCNGDEGDPGAFMDRSLMEGDPHGVLEGMTIGAYAIGASRAYMYVRDEYPLAVENLEIALAQSRALGLLGNDIFGSGFSFDAEIVRGAGAFVCGEETALIASIEGQRGMPRTRPPFPAESGLWDKPTNINNVETWANIPVIIDRGADWFSQQGTEKSKGTKTFALVGQVKNTGLVEVPLGITLREMIFDIGGGVLGDKAFKAVQTGGPSGGCLPASLLDTPVDYDSLKEAGSIMGSGGMVVMDEDTCMVDFARYFLDFAQKESCGKCVPCRLGTKQLLDILVDITEGRGREEDIDLLVELGEAIKLGSLCGLGQTAPNPVLTTIRYFREEYETHIRDKRCPAGTCRALTTFEIDAETCIGCGLCKSACPTDAVTGEKKSAHAIIQENCTRCGACRAVCPVRAVKVL